MTMYRKYAPDNDYSEWTEEYTVLKCQKDIECERGVFEKDSLVMIQTCNSEEKSVNIIDFVSVCIRVKKNPSQCDYVNEIKIDNLWDYSVISPDDMDSFFERSDKINQKLHELKKTEKKMMVVMILGMLLSLIGASILVITVLAELGNSFLAFSTSLIAVGIGIILFANITANRKNIKFCDSVISCSDYGYERTDEK